MKKLEEKTLKHELVYEGPVINVYEDHVLLNDKEHYRVYVKHPGGVAIALEDEDGKFFVVSQYRYGQKEILLEFPAGKIEQGEDPLETATREIQEETGYEGMNFEYLGKMIPTAAYNSEVIYMYTAKIGTYVGQHLDPDEELFVEKLSLEELKEKVITNEITDSKTMIMTFLLEERRKQREDV